MTCPEQAGAALQVQAGGGITGVTTKNNKLVLLHGGFIIFFSFMWNPMKPDCKCLHQCKTILWVCPKSTRNPFVLFPGYIKSKESAFFSMTKDICAETENMFDDRVHVFVS